MTRTIDMTNIENKHKTYTYNLKNENDVKITNLFTNFLDSIKIKISGNTLSISVLEPMGPVLKFTNISNLKDINLNVYQKEGNPDYLNKNFQLMIDDVWASHPGNVDYWTIKNRTLTGTNFDDDIDITDSTKYTVVDGIGWTVNSLKGNDTIEGTTGKDTITGGLGKDTIVFSEGNDLVKLTKNEELVIDVSALGLNTPEDIIRAQGDIQASTNKNGDLILTMLNEENTQHQITISKFVKTNGVGSKGKVNLYLGKNEESQDVYYDLNTKAIMYFDEEDASYKKKSNTATLTGTRLGDDISIDGGTINALNNANNAKITIKAGDGNNFINLVNALNTNTITTGAGDDVIEIEDTSDITESTPKALTTVKAGAGENKIKIEGSGNNSIITGKDDDTFNIKGDSISVIKAGGGNNTININDDSFGVITLVDEKIKNTKNDIVFEFDEGVHLMAAYKSGDNLILKTGDSSLIINNYFLQTGKNAVKTLDGYELANLGGFLEKNGLELAVEGTKKITGTDLSETIMGSDKADTINANGGADEITGGKGKDTINAGAGDNKIIYHTGDGNDTILYGGADATDTLVFDDGMTVSAKYSGKNLLVDYIGKDYTGKDVKNTITIKNFKTAHSVQYVQIGDGEIKSIDEIINGGGGGGDTKTYTSTSANETFNLQAGNNKITFPASTDDFGIDKVTTQNTAGNGYTDTLYFPNHSVEDNEIAFWMVDADDPENVDWNTYKDIQVDAWLDNTEYGGQVNFKGLLDNHSNLVIQDKNRSYTANGYFGVQENPIDYTQTTTNNITFVNHSVVADNTVTIKANNKYNYSVIYSLPLEYQYNGGHDYVNSDCGGSDTYKIGQLSTSTSLQVQDAGGSDAITVTNNAADISLICNVYKNGEDWEFNENHFVLITKNDVSVDSLQAATGYTLTSTAGLNYKSYNSTITHSFNTADYNGSEAKTTAWYGAIAESVGAWLGTTTYDSVEGAIEAYNENPDTVDLSGLIAAYKNVDYSTINA